MHLKKIRYTSKYQRLFVGAFKLTSELSYSKCFVTSVSPEGRNNVSKFKQGFCIGNHYRVPILGKPLLSIGNFNFKIYTVNRSNVDSRRYLSFESVACMQSNLFTFLSESTPVHHAQMFFENVHDASGLPWWASIVLTTFIVRSLVAFPLALHQNYILAKVQNLQHEMRDIAKDLGMEVSIAIKKYGWSKSEAQIHYKYSLRKQWDKLVVRDNCHPFKASLPIWFQLPMWVFLSISLRNMAYMLPHHDTAAEMLYLELSHGGSLWFTNLIEVDHTLILPVTLGILNLAIVELQTIIRIKEPTKFQRRLTNFIRLLSIAMIPIASNVPACMSLYWVSSSVCGLLQNLLVLSPRIKSWVGIPKVISLGVDGAKSGHLPDSKNVKSQSLIAEQQDHLHNHPYQFIASELLDRMNRISARFGLGKGI